MQAAIAVILTLTLAGVLWYAWEARKQAKATQLIAEAALRPILVHWITRTRLPSTVLKVYYHNTGNGPALNIQWRLDPDATSRERLAMGTSDEKATVEFDISGGGSKTLLSEYEDANGNRWLSKLDIVEHNGALENGASSHTRKDRSASSATGGS
jgi:hypothetical protein